MPKYRETRNHTSLHVQGADGSTTNVDVYNEDSVATQLLVVLGRVLGAYRSDLQADLDQALTVQRLLDDAGVTAFLGRLGRLWDKHPSEAPADADDESPATHETAYDELCGLVAHARRYGLTDDDLREALAQALGSVSEECATVPCPPFETVHLDPEPDTSSRCAESHEVTTAGLSATAYCVLFAGHGYPGAEPPFQLHEDPYGNRWSTGESVEPVTAVPATDDRQYPPNFTLPADDEAAGVADEVHANLVGNGTLRVADLPAPAFDRFAAENWTPQECYCATTSAPPCGWCTSRPTED